MLRNSVRLPGVGCSAFECGEACNKALSFVARFHSNLNSFPETEREIGQGHTSRFMGKVESFLTNNSVKKQWICYQL